MEPIKDCVGRTICMVNRTQGRVEIKYRHLLISFTIEEGSSFSISREGIMTCITRGKDRCLITSRMQNTHH